MNRHPRNIVEYYQQHNYRVVLIVILCILLIIGLSIRMYYMQVVQYDFFNKKADNNRTQSKFIEPIRGNIYDRNGILLAGNNVVYNLGIVIENIKNKDFNKIVSDISALIPIKKSDLERFKENRRTTRVHEPVILKTRLSQAELAKIEVNLYHLQGVTIVEQHDRFYSYPKEFAHVIGYVGSINKKELIKANRKNYRRTSKIGKIGVEKQYETLLNGTGGNRKIETDVQSRILRVLSVKQAIAGTDIFLNIDARLQKYAYKAMGTFRGSVVAIDPNNFEVLAMVSTPSYDSSLFISGISHKDYNALNQSIDKPLFNRSLSGRYPAGSIFKPFLGLAGLESKTINSRNKVNCIGHYRLKNSNHKFRDWKKEGHGITNIHKAIQESCDVYFFDLAFKLGIDRIHPYLGLFGFGSQTGIDLPFEISGFIPSREWKNRRLNKAWRQGDTLNVGIGQGLVQVSPLQIAKATAILANNGQYYTPRLLNRTQRINQPSQLNPPDTLKTINIEDQKNWDLIIKSMKSVVHSKYGTARNISNSRYKIAGKTGTAQIVTILQDAVYDEKALDSRKHDHALFIAFSPADNPKIAVAVVVENGKHGSTTAAPIAKKVMDKYLLSILSKKQLTAKNPKSVINLQSVQSE